VNLSKKSLFRRTITNFVFLKLYMENTPSKSRFVLISAFLLLVLFILPAGSWYYLKKGADYRMEHINDMTPKGDFAESNIKGITKENIDSLRNKTILIGISNIRDTQKDEIMTQQVGMLVDQFGDRKDLKVIRMIEVEGIDDFGKSSESDHVWIANQSNESIKNCGVNSKMEKPFWSLVDYKGQIRNYYSIDDFEKLVVQSAMILPIEQRKKIDLKRDKEI